MGHGYLNMGWYCDDVDVKLWLQEMNSVNTTILCDRLLMKDEQIREGLIAITGEVFRSISILNLEQQSSGFKIVDRFKDDNGPEVLLLKVSPEDIKDELIIPNKAYWMKGFVWGKDALSYYNTDSTSLKEGTTHNVPTSKYGHQFILNFSVCGEFGIDIFFIPNEGDPVPIFGKSYCCK